MTLSHSHEREPRLIPSVTTSAQAFAKLFARQTASRKEPSSQEKPSRHESWRTAMGQPLSTFHRRALENVCEGGDKKIPAIIPLRIRFNSRVLTPSTEMSRSAPYQGIQVSASTPRRFTARLTLAAVLPISMKHRCPVQGKIDLPWGRRGGARGCLRNICRTLRSFEAFWYLKTLVGLRHRTRCWISSRLRNFS